MSISTSQATGRVQASEGDAILLPKLYQADGSRVGVLHLHGAGQTHTVALDATNMPNQRAIARRIAETNPVLSCDFGGVATWGNDTVLARITAAKAYLQGTLGAKAGKVVLVGQSMGGQNALVWAAQNMASVAAAVLIYPVSDVSDIVTNNRGGLAAGVNAAHSGGWSEATYGATRNPLTLATAGALSGLAAQMWQSDGNDVVVLQSTQQALAAAINAHGGTCDVRQLTGGHTEATVGTIDLAAVTAFIAARTA